MNPKFNLVYSNSKILTYKEHNNKIFKEDILLKRDRSPFIEFENIPLKNWKVKFIKDFYVPVNAHYYIDSFVLIHPNNDNITIPIFNFETLFCSLNIENGVIKNEIILLSEGYYTSFDYEGSSTYQQNLSLLTQDSFSEEIKLKNLEAGSLITFDKNKSEKTIFLGQYFVRDIFYLKDKNELHISSIKKIALFLNIVNRSYSDEIKLKEELMYKSVEPKNIILLENIPSLNKDFSEILNKDIFLDNSIFGKLNSKKLIKFESYEYLNLGCKKNGFSNVYFKKLFSQDKSVLNDRTFVLNNISFLTENVPEIIENVPEIIENKFSPNSSSVFLY